jgi:hypothetical protein
MDDEHNCENCRWYKVMTDDSGICKKVQKVVNEWDNCEGHEEE